MRQVVQLASISTTALFFVVIALVPNAHGQAQIGGVSLQGEWYAGEGLKEGDYFSYDMCHVNYKECKRFQMEFWIEGEKIVGNESKWLASTVVRDGNKVIKGTMELGKVAPEPTGGSPELLEYRSAFKSSIVWLSAFATSYSGSGSEGPKSFSDPSWGKIANIGGEQILPTEVRTITTPADTFEDAISVTWKTGGALSEVWIVDEFPFPIRASTFVHVSEGIPPQEYKFELLAFGTSDTDPYIDVVPTQVQTSDARCIEEFELAKKRSETRNGNYLINFQYGPAMPIAGCDMTMLIDFHNKYDATGFLNQVQYDVIVTDTQDEILFRLSDDEGVRTVYSASGQVRNFEMWVPSEPGDYVYALVINGLAPLNTVPSTPPDILRIPITVVGDSHIVTPSQPPAAQTIPPWVKNAAGFWVDGITTDAEFVDAIGFLVSQNVIVVGEVDEPVFVVDTSVPSWIKNTTKFWVDGITTELEFVSAIEFLISKGIIVIG